jgi:adenine phosphoribosyltransferase
MKLNMDLKKHIRSIKDYPKKGILFRDITTLIKNPEAFKYTNDKIIELSKKIDFDKVSAIESRGFIFAAAVSYILNKPFILLRKKNKLPADTHSIDFKLEYGEATIEVHKDSILKNEKILVIDDLIATGGTAEAAAKLIEISGGKVAGFIFVINLFDLPGNELLKKKGYKTQNLVEFPGH